MTDYVDFMDAKINEDGVSNNWLLSLDCAPVHVAVAWREMRKESRPHDNFEHVDLETSKAVLKAALLSFVHEGMLLRVQRRAP